MSIRSKLITAAAAAALVISFAGGAVAYTGVPAGFSFTQKLNVGSISQDVVYLKTVLANEGCISGVTNTTYFGVKTGAAVKCFKTKYAIGSGTTLVSTLTNAKLNQLIGGTGSVPPPVVGGGLAVSLATDTPASAQIADDSNANFTKINLTAGSSGSVSISKMYVTRGGLALDSYVENIKLVEAATGVYRGTVASLNVDHRAMITFTPALVIPAGTTQSYYLRAGILNGTGSGYTVTLGINSNADIVSNASSVTGAPVVGNAMTTLNLAIGTLTVAEDGTTVDSTPDVGDTNVVLNQFKFTAGSTEAVTVETITAMKAGTADMSDIANIELYDVTHNKSLGTVSGWDSEEKASWSNLGLSIAKGESLRLKIMADIIGGVASTALTVNADVVDGSDTLVVARGQTYGFYITVNESSWNGKGSNNQTINAGALNISKSAASPATGKIAAGDNVVLGVFDFDARGEEMKITQVIVEATLGTMTYDQVTNVKIYDENGTIVAGPQDMDSTPDATFTDTFIVPVGVHKYTVKAKIADGVSTSDTILVDLDRPGTSITAKGMTSGDSITATPATDVSANTLTVAAGDLNEITLTTPVAASVAKGFADYIWATGSLSAADSGEDVIVSTVSVLDTTSASPCDADDVDNMELWADLTSANSTRGDVYETKISNTENPSGNAAGADVTTAFTLTQPITITKGNFVKVALVADLNANAAGTVDSSTYTFTFSAATATGASSGQDITEDVSGSGQAMTITTSGTLTLTKDASSPVADIVVSGQTATLGVFRLAASNVENLDVDDLTFTVTGGASVDTYYLYKDSTLIGTQSSGTAPKFTLTDGTVTVPKNSYVRLTLKGVMTDKDSTTNNTTVTAGLNGTHAADAVNCTGLASGSEVDSDAQDAAGNGMDLYKTKPTFAAVTSRSGYQLSGNLIPSSSMLTAIFDVTANANEDVTFEASTGTVIIHVSRVMNDSDGSSNTWTLKDQDGTTLDTSTVADADTTVTFDFASSALTVPAGQTKSLLIYADTTELEDDGDTIQLHLDDDNSGANIIWSINNNAATYNDGDKIFRGDIYSGSFVNPS